MQETHIHLAGLGWHKKNGISVKGSAYAGGSLLGAEELCVAAQNTSSESELLSFIQNLNGFFAIIIEKDEALFSAVDIIRSIPLFYSVNDGVLKRSFKASEMNSTSAV